MRLAYLNRKAVKPKTRNFGVNYRWRVNGQWHYGRTVVKAETAERARKRFMRENPHVQFESIT